MAAAAGTSVIARQVLLRGRYSATVYAYAVSLLLVDRLPADVLRGLDLEPSGLGRILLNSQLENRREILWYGCETIADLPESIEVHTGNRFISRTYRILVGNRPMMLINEKFPIDSPVGQEGG
ncbi:MAG: chorismate--pyruvate lyase family protein [Caldilinea sp.]